MTAAVPERESGDRPALAAEPAILAARGKASRDRRSSRVELEPGAAPTCSPPWLPPSPTTVFSGVRSRPSSIQLSTGSKCVDGCRRCARLSRDLHVRSPRDLVNLTLAGATTA